MVDKLIQWMDRAKSRVYAVFIFWLLVLFAPIVFTALFVDQELIYKATGMLKGEYIESHFLQLETWAGRLYIILSFCAAAGLTWLTIWKLPKWIVNRAYSQELDNQYAREDLRLIKEQELEEKKAANIKKEEENIEKEEKIAEQREDLELKGRKEWLREYKQFEKSQYYESFKRVIQCLYENNGWLNGNVPLSTDLIAYIDSNGIVDYDRSESQLTPTEKGKFFIQQYQNRNL